MACGLNYFNIYKARAVYVNEILKGPNQRICPSSSPPNLSLS
jgi:hypothetical protein